MYCSLFNNFNCITNIDQWNIIVNCYQNFSQIFKTTTKKSFFKQEITACAIFLACATYFVI